MYRRDFNTELIQGLFKIRNREGLIGIREWLRQCITLERKRRSV